MNVQLILKNICINHIYVELILKIVLIAYEVRGTNSHGVPEHEKQAEVSFTIDIEEMRNTVGLLYIYGITDYFVGGRCAECTSELGT